MTQTWQPYTVGPKKAPGCTLPSWKPLDLTELHQAECSILEKAAEEGLEIERNDVETGTGSVHCLRIKGQGTGDDMLVLHGFGGGAALWALNMKTMADNCGGYVYIIDLPGFGRSTRTKTTNYKSTADAEDFFLSRLEGLREAVGITEMTIVGHSFGAYLSACYALKYHEVVRKVVLVDPWGVGIRDDEAKKRAKKMPWYIKAVAKVAEWSGPLFLMRATGPLGPGLLPRFRPDLVSKWDDIFPGGQVAEYIYQCNAISPPAGEEAFMSLHIPFGYAKDPLLSRPFDSSQDVHIIYGEKSWMNPQHGEKLASVHTGRSSVSIVSGAGHHVYIDNVNEFNTALAEVL